MSSFFASCPRGCEEILATEIEKLNAKRVKKTNGGVLFRAEDINALKVLLNTRVASRVYLKLLSFDINHEKQVYRGASELDWTKVFLLKQTFKISTLFDKDAKRNFKSSIIFSQILKDAIVDQFRKKLKKRPNVEKENPTISILQRVEAKKGKTYTSHLYIDLCGEPLSNRGFNRQTNEAPLRENLAAAIVLKMDLKEEDTFYDLMCGSGTAVIEAMLAKNNISPSFIKIREIVEENKKVFAFQKHLWFTNNNELTEEFNKFSKELNQENLSNIEAIKPNQFFANDIDENNLKIIKKNLRKSKLPVDKVHYSAKDATVYSPVTNKGVVFCNPPYGERLGATEDLKDLYNKLGENFKENFKGFNAYVITSDRELKNQIFMTTKEKTPLWNGPLETRLLKYEIF